MTPWAQATPATATLAELAALVGGTTQGDNGQKLSGAGPIGDVSAGQITLIDHADRLPLLAKCSAAAVVMPDQLEVAGLPSIVVADVHQAFATIVAYFHPPRVAEPVGRHPRATIAPSAKFAKSAQVHAGAFIGDDVVLGERTTVHAGAVVMAGCQLGDDVTVFPNATLYEETVVGDRCLIHAGAVLGAYGFGYSQQDGRHKLAAQLGTVELGDDVEVGAGATIDRGVYGPTRIGEGTKVDNLTQVAHNCQIGRHNLICSQVGIAGSTTTGDYVVMAGQAGVRDHVHIGDGAQLGAMCGVSNDVAAGQSVLGAPAVPVRDQKLRFAAIAKLPEMRKEFKALRKQVAELEKQFAAAIQAQSQSAAERDRAA
ncbi:MAG: UDP-3-O-(3-hydroxymyristoyl)glucosamine N-acyltransferase [Planctomycetota bacterium]